MRILLDSNILLRSVEIGHPHHFAVSDAIRLLRRQGHHLSIIPQVLYEFWTVATRPLANNGLGMDPSEATEQLRAMKRVFRLLRDERSVFRFWEQIVSDNEVRGNQSHDARIAAAMQRHAVRYLLTFNVTDFTRYSAIHAVSPTDIVSGAAAVPV